jgi:glycosyltransferase involved in cell wall biosynthesis
MRLLFVTPFYFPELKFGGPPEKIHGLSKGLRQRGHDVRVVTFLSGQPDARRVEVREGVPVRYLPWFGWKLRQWPRCQNDVRSEVETAQIVHCFGLFNFICPAAARSARKRGRPYLLEPMGMYVPRGRNLWLKKMYHRLFTLKMAALAGAIVATSAGESEELKALSTRGKRVLRRNGIDVGRFNNLPSGELFRQRCRVSAETRIALFLGRLSPIKNLEQLIRAFSQAGLERAVLALAGPSLEPSYESELRSTIASLGLAERVCLPGPVYGEEKLSALAAAELFVLPSLNESYGNAAAEAVAAGVPVLLTNTCGIAPVIHKRAGLSVPLGVEPLSVGLKTLLDNPDERRRLTAKRSDVVRELSWDDPVLQMEAIYRSLLVQE